LLVNRFYYGDQTPTGRMLRDVARRLVEGGHVVRVLTAGGQGYNGDHVEGDGPPEVHIKRVGGGRALPRLFEWTRFWLWTMFEIPLLEWDRCVILTDPPFMIAAAVLCRRLRRGAAKAFWWTMDLYPEAMIAKGMIAADGPVARMLFALNRWGMRNTAGVIVLGPAQRRLLKRYGDFEHADTRCIVVPPWDHRPLPRVTREKNRLLAEFGWQRKKVALYAGNLGEAHSFRGLLDAATILARRGEQEWLFVFVVRGSERGALEHAARDMANVVVLDYQPPEMTADLLNAATVHVVTMKSGWGGIVVPSKLAAIAATGIPVLFIGPPDSDTAVEIDERGLGACVDTEAEAERIVVVLEQLAARPRNLGMVMPTDGPARIAAFITA